ncbi:MAG: short-chain dehydrogenase [Elusimicrobia bacterium GWA2_62_23]|nr:MAG: short-chain dehydrogenase [Elusimicrobia bacterium GWA2_62_23]OGR68751.1 MAG: short-chain dehydrogenase [Elusimicrobia bacterium GWC2_63_65]
MKGRRALITGASRGIGLATAEAFRARGAMVIAPSHSELDLASDVSIDKYLAGLSGGVDILVNNAGINPLGSAEEFTDPDLEAVLQVNLKAPMRLLRGLLPAMRERGYGRIVNVSSVWSFVSKPRRFAYSSVKAGINGMTRAAAVECAKAGILVNSVAPGYVNTELTRKNNSPAELAAISAAIPAGRLAEPSEIAAVIAFLASEQNAYITGQTIAVDGGYTCL